MKIAVLGATGATGSVFLRIALDAGHQISALVRDASKLAAHKESKQMEIIIGNALSEQDVTQVVAGADGGPMMRLALLTLVNVRVPPVMTVVVSCLGHVPGGPCPMMSIAFSNIMNAAAKQDAPPRCVLMTTIGVGGTSAFVKCFLGVFLAGIKVISDYEKADRIVRESTSNVPFVLVRPGHLLDGPATGKYKVSHKGFYHAAMQITRADVAMFLLHAASTDKYDKQAVQLFT